MRYFFLCFIVAWVLVHSTANHAGVPQTKEKSTEKTSDTLPLGDLQRFTLIFDRIRQSYVESVSDQQLLENAIIGMLQELDPHSDYLDTKAFQQLQKSTKGEFMGLGIEIGTDQGYIKVITPIDDSPAAKAGVKAGDLIIKLDERSLNGFTTGETAKLMRGKRGTVIKLTILREGQDKPIEISVVRDKIRVRSVRSQLLEEHFAYIRIAQFQLHTAKDFRRSIKKMYQKSPELKGMVLDLRNNPGGILQASIDVVDTLLDEGLIVYTKGRLSDSEKSFSATVGDMTNGLPVVILINGGSASAAEIVSGALQDQQRAVIMGTPSFGKGSVQTVFPVGQDKAIKLTTALYYTPKGRSIQADGIEPDVLVEPARITQLNRGVQIKEANLSGHLAQNQKNNTKKQGSQTIKDNQLFEAINLLKGLAIFSQRQQDSVNK